MRDADGSEPAEISIVPVPEDMDGTIRYLVTGSAFYGAHRKYGPNMGSLCVVCWFDEKANMIINDATYKLVYDESYSLKLSFSPNGDLVVAENAKPGLYGMGVSFEGVYTSV